ncbi:LysR family transcriptional regulator [Ramlibacter albus]|uniref:LysR family transcriptional regulator n=1 Tax=Ramlibacter albus TaxID=2079448 RepID=A0A923MBC4_9BURK|nr:LysR family transcriptional regulator [Ramlibacter albus]MBC5767682.1 LysR family transcriptional regulator [Ramlibacter albus]
MRNATLRQLKVFEAVARHLSFSRAAEELHLTQPAVSTQVRKLQEHVGLPLYEQLGKKVHLTPAGAQMLVSSREIIQKFKEAEEALAAYKGVSGGRLNVAVISAGDYFFPSLLVEFAQRHEGVTLNFGVCNREELLAQLAGNLTDLGIMVRPPDADSTDTVAEPFAPHPYVIVAPPSHPLASRKRIPVARIAKEPFIVREKGSDTWHSMVEAFGERIDDVNIAMEIKSTETIKQAVAAGMGVGFLSAHTISRELKSRSLVVLDVLGFPLMLNWYVVHRRTKRLPPVAQAFKLFLVEEGASQIERALSAAPRPARRHSG